MGGLFGVAAKDNCVYDLFFGVDYHSHLGTKRGGMAVYGKNGFERAIHNIQNSPFRTKFERDVEEMKGYLGIGCISDTEPQPLIVRAKSGSYSITTVGRINNLHDIEEELFRDGNPQFLEMSGGELNPTEVVAALINQKETIAEGIAFAQEKIDGSMTMLVMTKDGIYASRDRYGRTPLIIGQKDGARCVSFESFAYLNLGYTDLRELGPGEIVFIEPDNVTQIKAPEKKLKICAFLWVYYGYPTSSYEGISVEEMRYRCGASLAENDDVSADLVAGVPDSGTAHAVGYANRSQIPFSRPFIKYTPTWPRSFMPPNQAMRDFIAKMKLIPVDALIRGKSLILIDDSIVRGTQLAETADFLYKAGAKEVHIRPACPPYMFGCKYLNFSRSTSEMDLITRKIILRLEGEKANSNPDILAEYANPDTDRYHAMMEAIKNHLHFTSLKYQRLDELIKSIGLPKECLCTYCWDGEK